MKSKKLTSLNTVKVNDWLFKTSELNGTVCIVAHHELMNYTIVRFFLSDASAHNWVEYLLLQDKNGLKSTT
jgi:hypothetical protein